MGENSLGRIALLLIASILCFIVGRMIGTAYAEHQSERERIALATSTLMAELREIGRPLPCKQMPELDVDVWWRTRTGLSNRGVVCTINVFHGRSV